MNDTLLGQVFALADYRDQANFLNVVGKTINRTCESGAYRDIQLCRIADELDDHGRKLIQTLASFLDRDGGK